MEKQNYDFDQKCDQSYNENIAELTEQWLKESIENVLVDWFNIEDKQIYDSLKKLLEKYNIISLCWYQEIIDAYKIWERTDKYQFSLSYNKDDNMVYVYPASNAWFSSQCWYIQWWKYYESINIFNIDLSSNNLSQLPINNCSEASIVENIDNDQINSQTAEWNQENDQLRENQQKLLEQVKQNSLEIQDLKNQLDKYNFDHSWLTCDARDNIGEWTQIDQNNQDTQREIESTVDKFYTVKSWDTLWEIVKTHYRLKSNRDIANCVNKLVKYNIDNKNAWKLAEDNTPDGIFWDKIYVWQKIILANALTFRTQKFTLINTET